jgi:hypothetical protein
MSERIRNIAEHPGFNSLTDREQSFVERKIGEGADPDAMMSPHFWRGRRRLKLTAMHELGHATVAKFRGWFVSTISVIREGNVLGYVKSIPQRTGDGVRLLKDRIALSYGGLMMEERVGHTDHSGANFDMNQARRAAIILAAHEGGTPEDYMAEGRATAHEDLQSISLSHIEAEAENLMEKGKIAA